MAGKRVLLGQSIQSPTDNKKRQIVIVPGQSSEDFILTARCRIMNTGEKLTVSASDLPSDPGGTYSWQTNSTNIQISPAYGTTVTIEALNLPSAARDAEVVTVTRTGPDGSTKNKTLSITVAKVSFSASPSQQYGYDDLDTPSGSDDHVSVASSEETVVAVSIEGGALGDDFEFLSDNTSILTVEQGPRAATFDLRLRAKKTEKAETALRARSRCPSPTTFSSIKVNIYAEKIVDVIVAKVVDNNSPGTQLSHANADYASFVTTANSYLKEAVVRFKIKNFDSTNSVTNLRYDSKNVGFLSFDIAAAGGEDFKRIDAAIPKKKGQEAFRVVIVKSMKSYYYLNKPAKRGDTSLSVRGPNVYTAQMVLGSGTTQETVAVVSNNKNVATLQAPLLYDHSINESLEFPAAAWGTNPIIIAEGNATVDIINRTILHEVGHTALGLKDVNDLTNIMSHAQSPTATRLRYSPRQTQYSPSDKENQWEKINRRK